VEPISLDYRGTRVWECPPNGQGLAALIALNVLRHLPVGDVPAESPEYYHLLIESMRLRFAEAQEAVFDPDLGTVPISELLNSSYGRERAASIAPDRRMPSAEPGGPARGLRAGDDTVYLAAVDRWGNGCSFINSNYMGFGTGIVPKECGFSLQNRRKGFSLDPTHPGCLEPPKRPYHTIIPALGTREADGELACVFGVMGGMMQPQGHLQVASALVDDDVDPQAALDRPRFQLEDGRPGAVMMETSSDESPSAQATGLEALGHPVQPVAGISRYRFGLGQVIESYRGMWWGGSDPRGDGFAVPGG